MKANRSLAKVDFAPGKAVTVASVPDGFQGVVVGDLARMKGGQGADAASLAVLCRDAERLASL